jgi:release factor glutamine methyltransferase
MPGVVVHATDISAPALEVARRNIARHGVADRVHAHLGDLCAPLRGVIDEGSVDVVLSNPPYVARSEAGQVDVEVLWEPASAIFADGSPEGVYTRGAASAAPFVRPGGRLFVELPGTRVEPVAAALGAAPGWRPVAVHDDLAGLPRVGEYERRRDAPRAD